MEATKLKITDAINFFLDELLIRGYKEITIKTYTNIMDRFNQFITSECECIKYVNEITEKHVYIFRTHLRTIESLTQSVIDMAISCLRTFYKILNKMNILSINVMDKLRHKRETKQALPLSLEIEEVEEIGAAIGNKNNSSKDMSTVIFTLVSKTGSTRSTILSLKWRDIDFDEGLIILDRDNYRKRRTLKMSKELYNILLDFKGDSIIYDNDYVLRSKTNKKLSPSHFTTLFKRAVEQWEQLKFNIINNSSLNEIEKKKKLRKAKVTSTVIRNSFIKFLINNNLDIVLVKNAVGLIDYKSIHRFR